MPCLQVRNIPVRLTSSTWRQTPTSRRSARSSCPASRMPAFATTVSSPPNLSSALVMARSTCAASATSAASATAVPAASAIAAAVSAAAAWFTSRQPTRAPSAASLSAAARPIPLPAPVTTARLPSNRPPTSAPSVADVGVGFDLDQHPGDLMQVAAHRGPGGVRLGKALPVGRVVAGEEVRVDQMDVHLDDVGERRALGAQDRLDVVDRGVRLLLGGVARDLPVGPDRPGAGDKDEVPG